MHSFDPTPELHAKHRRNHLIYRSHNLSIHFHYLGLGATRENITSSYGRTGLGPVAHIGELMRTYARGRPVDVLKIDCEGCEWEEFAHTAANDPQALCGVSRMVQLELHMSSALRFTSVSDARALFRHLQLDHGFRVVDVTKNIGLKRDQGVAPSLLGSREAIVGIDREACCYNVHFVRTPQRFSPCAMHAGHQWHN